MNKTLLLQNLKYLILGLAVAGVLSLAHAQFAMPTTSAPGNNIDAPLHTGPDQVKDGGLSVNTFLANDNAQFKQETFLNGTVFGGAPSDATSTVTIGDSITPSNVAVNGSISANKFIQNASVANSSNETLCADTSGTIVTCTGSSNNFGPIQYISSHSSGGVKSEILQIESPVKAGNVYSFTIYYHTVSVTAVAGDSTATIAQKLASAVNGTTTAQWKENPYQGTTSRPNDPNAAPSPFDYSPNAQVSPNNSTWIIVNLDSAHSISLVS